MTPIMTDAIYRRIENGNPSSSSIQRIKATHIIEITYTCSCILPLIFIEGISELYLEKQQ